MKIAGVGGMSALPYLCLWHLSGCRFHQCRQVWLLKVLLLPALGFTAPCALFSAAGCAHLPFVGCGGDAGLDGWQDRDWEPWPGLRGAVSQAAGC